MAMSWRSLTVCEVLRWKGSPLLITLYFKWKAHLRICANVCKIQVLSAPRLFTLLEDPRCCYMWTLILVHQVRNSCEQFAGARKYLNSTRMSLSINEVTWYGKFTQSTKLHDFAAVYLIATCAEVGYFIHLSELQNFEPLNVLNGQANFKNWGCAVILMVLFW